MKTSRSTGTAPSAASPPSRAVSRRSRFTSKREHDQSTIRACRAATCGTCRVQVVEGGEALSTPDEFELEVLDMFGDTPDKVRLCCQAKLIG
ncbi:MAG: (2Fe-2S)-binding protein, partial [Deltaproteobacteria bacterium]|nr:(2Fe-2S)-binding protein [Deltaproteobacteria bacterium]